MIINLQENRIYTYDDRKLKEHKAISTNFSHFEILPNGKILIIENYYNYHNGENSNLYCLNQNIEIEYFVPTTKSEDGLDLYVGFTTNGKNIFANTWNCFRVEIDSINGKIISREFTK